MGNPYVGEIRIFAGDFAPLNWAFCDGTLLSIAQYDVLFNLLGTTYGGNGQTTFALPDLRSRVPLHMGQGSGLSPYSLGQNAGVESVTLATAQIPQHNHSLAVSGTPGSAGSPRGNSPGISGTASIYRVGTAADALSHNALPTITGQNLPHSNIQPLQALNFIIALYGIYPQPS